jgi:hypothetical protein
VPGFGTTTNNTLPGAETPPGTGSVPNTLPGMGNPVTPSLPSTTTPNVPSSLPGATLPH